MAYIPKWKQQMQQFRFLKTYFANFYKKYPHMAWRLLEELIDETPVPPKRRRRCRGPVSTGGFVAEPVRTMEQKRAMVADGIAQWDWYEKGEICF